MCRYATLLALALLLAGVAPPAASAKSGVGVKLSVLPLPKSVIGPAANSLPLQPDSGVAPNTDAARRGWVLIPTRSVNKPCTCAWKRLGRVDGYALDYGLGASGGAGVTEVYTSVSQYKTGAGAKGGLALWKRLDAGVSSWLGPSGQGPLAFAFTAEKVPPLGSRRFAVLVSYSAANIAPVFGLDEQFTEGRYEADVTIWAGHAAAAIKLAQTLAKKLDTRIKRALKGELHAKSVKLPPKQTPGPSPGGPDLTALALQQSDFSSSTYGLIEKDSYFIPALDPSVLSAYYMSTCFAPKYCGAFLDQDIEWCPTANQASFMADFWAAFELRYGFSPLDLSGVGDGAQGFLQPGNEDGAVVLSSGQLIEFIQVYPVQASDLQSLARTAANYINAAGLGS